MNEMPTKFSKLIEFRWNCAAGFGFEVGFELNDSSSDPVFCLMRKYRKFERNGFEQSQFKLIFLQISKSVFNISFH